MTYYKRVYLFTALCGLHISSLLKFLMSNTRRRDASVELSHVVATHFATISGRLSMDSVKKIEN